jgi:1,4-alpha-glucan branching enzyme
MDPQLEDSITNGAVLFVAAAKAKTIMKHNRHHSNSHGTEAHLVPVRFEFTHPTATSVCVAGTFNDWRTEAKPMHSLGNGKWLKESELPAGTYEYRLVVDGEWTDDPQAKESVPNPYGGRNSVLEVAGMPETLQHAGVGYHAG